MRPTSGLAVMPREAVRAAAFEADAELGERARLALVALGDRDQLVDSGEALPRSRPPRPARLKRGCARGRFGDQLREQPVELVRFAAQAEDQHAAGVGMAARAASMLRVPARSSPSCEQPNGWAKAWTPSTRPA